MSKAPGIYRNYTVYFELFGRKMKTTVMALHEDQAKQKVAEKIIFHKVEAKKDDALNQVSDLFEDIFEVLK